MKGDFSVFMSCHQKARQNYDVKIAIKTFENLAGLKRLEMTKRNKQLYSRLNEEINFQQCLLYSLLSRCPDFMWAGIA
jgi:hypothetical protein